MFCRSLFYREEVVTRPCIISDGDSRIRVSPEISEGLIPKTGPQFEDLRGASLAPSLRDWRDLPPGELELMKKLYFDDKVSVADQGGTKS